MNYMDVYIIYVYITFFHFLDSLRVVDPSSKYVNFIFCGQTTPQETINSLGNELHVIVKVDALPFTDKFKPERTFVIAANKKKIIPQGKRRDIFVHACNFEQPVFCERLRNKKTLIFRTLGTTYYVQYICINHVVMYRTSIGKDSNSFGGK